MRRPRFAPCRRTSSLSPSGRPAGWSHTTPARSSGPSLGVTGREPREVRMLDTDDGLVVLVTLALEGGVSLADAHDEATAVSERIRAELPGVADVVVHTEP